MDQAHKQQPSLAYSMKEFASIPWLFASLFGAPSVLVIFDELSINFSFSRLVYLFLEHYQQMLTNITSFLEPIIDQFTKWLSTIVGFDVKVSEYWISIFVISIIYNSANTRTLWADGYRSAAAVYAFVTAAVAFISSVVAGLTFGQNSILAQSFISAQFGFSVFFGVAVSYMLFYSVGIFDRNYFRPPSYWLVLSVWACLFGIAGGVLLSHVPLFEDRAGLATIFFGMLGYGLWWLGLSMNKRDMPTLGFIIRFLGGFIVAALIILFDIGYRIAIEG
jgi:hypothetical protein